MTSQPVKTFFPQTRLAELASRPGGIARSDAIASAKKSIESSREEGDKTIAISIAVIGSIVGGAQRNKLSSAQMNKILRHADQIVTLAGTFGYGPLDTVMRSMCDVTDGLMRAGLSDAAPIAVHVQSMQLMAPGSTALSPEEVDRVLSELAKVLTHYKFGSLAAQGAPDDDNETTIAAAL